MRREERRVGPGMADNDKSPVRRGCGPASGSSRPTDPYDGIPECFRNRDVPTPFKRRGN